MEKASVSVRTGPKESVSHFPGEPGVYVMRDREHTILYVGKAKNLRNRVRSYFSRDKDVKTAVLMKKVDSIDYIVCRSEYEALLLENNLIKENRPRYNINLKDGKTYPVIRITNEKWPRVFRTRNVVQDGSTYFGPYANVHQIDRYLEVIEKLFPLRKCRGPIRKREHPCLYYHIGRCAAVCAGKTSHDEYMRRIESIRKLLSGEADALIADLEHQMDEAVADLKFEKAADLRDTIAAIRGTQEEQQVVDFDPDVRDYLGIYEKDGLVSMTIFHMRGGKMLGTELFHSDVYGEASDYVPQFLIQYYTAAKNIPEKLVIGAQRKLVRAIAPDLRHFFAEELGKRVVIRAPEGSRDESVVNLAAENARRDFEKRVRESGNIPGLEELQKVLRLPRLPLRIEGFDIAHVDGRHPVASLVSFQNGRPDKSSYRKFHMRTLDGNIDDFAAMREVVARRYTRVANDELAAPDLILIDGGKGQVSSTVSVLQALELDIPVVGIAKREEELFLPGESEGIRLPEGSEPLRILQAVRDEAHRFATTFRAGLQSADFSLQTLESVPGIGPTRSKRLIAKFKSLDAIASATPESIAAEAKIPYETAEAVRDATASAVASAAGERSTRPTPPGSGG
ncbi:MAG: excinuclease ABC subunit UvrC [Spirochaetota bacterium]